MPFNASTRGSFGPQSKMGSGSASGLFQFTSHTFTNGGNTGPNGPSLALLQSAYSSATWAQNTTFFNTSNGIQLWTVPKTGNYTIVARGANGKAASNVGGSSSGGRGIIVTSTHSLTQGEVLRILVGQVGSSSSQNGGGGGGTFITKSPHNTEASILVIAGGGGGRREGTSGDGIDANSGQAGFRDGAVSGASPSGVTTNNNGGGGFTPSGGISLGYGGHGASGQHGDGGAGFFGDGNLDDSNSPSSTANAAKAFINGGLGGIANGGGESGGTDGISHGGFGGGGVGHGQNGGGGGGGYTGGSGGMNAGGAGSYVSASATNVSYSFDGTKSFGNSASNTGPGYVTITRLI